MNLKCRYSPEKPNLGQNQCFLYCVTLTFDLWPWPFARISLLSFVITPENFMMIRWWEHNEKDVTDGQTDRWMERSVLRATWSQLKTLRSTLITYPSNTYALNWYLINNGPRVFSIWDIPIHYTEVAENSQSQFSRKYTQQTHHSTCLRAMHGLPVIISKYFFSLLKC